MRNKLSFQTWEGVPIDRIVDYEVTSGVMSGVEVSNLGRIQDKKGRRSYGSKAPSESDKDSYMVAEIGTGDDRVIMRVHVLCALTFVGSRPSLIHTVDHIDGRKNNNRSGLLQWSRGRPRAAVGWYLRSTWNRAASWERFQRSRKQPGRRPFQRPVSTWYAWV
jgi:hypothetical protein